MKTWELSLENSWTLDTVCWFHIFKALLFSSVTESKPGQVCFKDFWAHALELIKKESMWLNNTSFTIYVDLSVKYKQDIYMNFDVPWWFLLKYVVHFFTFLCQFFCEDHNKEYPLTKLSCFLSLVLEKIVVSV